MKGCAVRSGVEMSTFIAAVMYGAFAVGYVAMLVLTERSAGRYVRGEIRVRNHRTTLRAITAAAPEPARETAASPLLSPVPAA
jgi:hypothetical protein